jgi:RimJ/RimL family protein N-acetyltransferase
MQISDTIPLYKMDRDKEVVKFLQEPVESKEETVEFIKQTMDEYENVGFSRFTIEHRKTGDILGWVGFREMNDIPELGKSYIDFGCRLNRNYWGFGFAYEATLACLAYGKDILKIKKAHAVIHEENRNSLRLIARLPLKAGKDVTVNGANHKVFIWDGK